MFEQMIAKRIVNLAGLFMTPALEQVLVILIRRIKEGDFCCPIEDPSILPKALWDEGCEGETLSKKPLIIQGNRLYLQKTWSLESLLIQAITTLLQRTIPPCNAALFHASLATMPSLNRAQREAIERTFGSALAIITGGPGTGKSYTAGYLIRLLAQAHTRRFKTVLTAPTGKAAAHLEASLQKQGPIPDHLTYQSVTLHRLLGLLPNQQKLFPKRMLDADLIVVDEASMLDGSLCLHLLQAIGPQTRLLLLGDPNQLSPIEGMGCFPEMAGLMGHPLETSMRMGEGSLFKLSQAILMGDSAKALQNQTESVSWLPWISEPSAMVEWLRTLIPRVHYQDKPDPLQVLQENKKFQILSVLRQGPFGVDALNRDLMEMITQERVVGWMAIPILITQNRDAQQLYNGTMGILIRGKNDSYAYFEAPDGIRSIPETSLPPYEMAFCLSVHKSQGSEFDEVVILLGPGAERFGKEALYTAVTRAKQTIRLCVEENTFQSALATVRIKRSGLTERLRNYFGLDCH